MAMRAGGSRYRNVGLLWLCFAIALTYLSVPIGHSLLFATALTGQAAFGTVILRALARRPLSSWLVLSGPGLILGGAISFALFQLVGRGPRGVFAVTLIGILAVWWLGRTYDDKVTPDATWGQISQVGGIAALCLSWEFEELLPIAVAAFAYGLITLYRGINWRIVHASFLVVGTALITVPLVVRTQDWWLITDDYTFFEVMSRHITTAGPLANWGATNWGQYHWLSYGWSGLLDLLGGRPETLVTLTRVMPLIYSVALSSSLLMTAQRWNTRKLPPLSLWIVTWFIVQTNPLDWSGTSSAGAIAVLISFVAALTTVVSDKSSLASRILLYALFLPIVMWTKLPSAFAAVVVLIIVEAAHLSEVRSRFRTAAVLVAVVLSCIGTLVGVQILGLITGRYVLGRYNPELGQMQEYGPDFAVGLVLMQHLPLVTGLSLFVGIIWQTSRQENPCKPDFLLALLVSIVLVVFGALLRVVVVAETNNSEYFSGPFLTIASLGILMVASGYQLSRATSRVPRRFLVVVGFLTCSGIFWVFAAEHIWAFLSNRVSDYRVLQVELLRFASANYQFGAVLGALLLFTVWAAVRQTNRQPHVLDIVWGFMLAVSVLTMIERIPTMLQILQRSESSNTSQTLLGSSAAQMVGDYLRANTLRDEIIATNYLRTSFDGSFSSDFALAMYSDREFLILGPRFFSNNPGATSAIRLSEQFANTPSEESFFALRESDVGWFVVDEQLTYARNWMPYGETVARFGRFTIVKLAQGLTSEQMNKHVPGT